MTAASIQNYIAGTWDIDPVHSEISFVVRHLGIAKVRGRFNHVEGEIVTGQDVEKSSVSAKIKADTVDTKNGDRDGHVKSPDFLDVEKHEHLTFASTGIRSEGGEFKIDGNLTIHGVTKQVSLDAEIGGFGDGPAEGSKVVGVSASTEINRSDFGVGEGIPTAVVSDKIKIELEIEAALRG